VATRGTDRDVLFAKRPGCSSNGVDKPPRELFSVAFVIVGRAVGGGIVVALAATT